MTMNLIEKCRGWFLWQASEFGKSIVLWHLLQTKILKAEVGRRKKKKRKCKTQFYLKILKKKMKVNGERRTEVCILAWTIGLFNILSNESFSLCGTLLHDVMAANNIGIPKQWNDAHVGVRNKPQKGFLSFQSVCIDAGHVSENAKLSFLI